MSHYLRDYFSSSIFLFHYEVKLIEVTNFEDDVSPQATEYVQPVAPAQDASAATNYVVPTPVAVASPVAQNPVTNTVTNPGQAEVDRVLTPEE